MTRFIPKDIISVADNESESMSYREHQIRNMVDHLPADDTFDTGLAHWGSTQAEKIFTGTDFRAERMSMLGHFAYRGQFQFMQAVLESATSPRENPLAMQTPIGNVGLIDYLCMVPKSDHVQALAAACRTLRLGSEQLQPVIDRLFSHDIWKSRSNKLQTGQILTDHPTYVQTMGILAAHGARLDAAIWATPKTDLLVRFMAQPFLERVGQNQAGVDLRLKIVDALLDQGFGRRISAHDNCPAYFAAKRNDPDLLGLLIAKGIPTDRKGPSGSPLQCLDEQDLLKTGSKGANRQRCRELLMVAAAHQAANKILEEIDSPSPKNKLPRRAGP